MSVSQPVISDIKNWFSLQHITVPVEWIEACVGFIQEDSQNANISLQQLKNKVFEQWLLADLEEIGVGILPPNLISQQKIVLPGKYALQVNGIRDIGKPAYSQLRQIEGTQNEDAEVSAAPKAVQPEWESKPTRMLLLNMTDGINFVQGMEYKPISLSLALKPGTKVLIKGPVDCRLGIIMLTQDKIKVLGGEVESLIQKYSQQNILREVLQLQANEETIQEVDDYRDTSSAISSTGIVSQRNDSHNQASNRTMPHRVPDDVNQIVNSYMENEPRIDNFDDDFSDIDYEALDEIERISSQKTIEVSSSNSSTDNNNSVQTSKTPESSFKKPSFTVKKEKNVNTPSYEEQTTTHSEVPFTFLNSLGNSANLNCNVTIKGFINKVLSRLQCNKEMWQLTARISDGTASIEADFHDKVLEQLVGISAKNMVQLQIQARQNAEIKTKILEAVNNCKEKMQKLNCLMEIQFKPSQRPCVVNCL